MTAAGEHWRRDALTLPAPAWPTGPAGAEALTVVVYADGGVFLDVLAGVDAARTLHDLTTILDRRKGITT